MNTASRTISALGCVNTAAAANSWLTTTAARKFRWRKYKYAAREHNARALAGASMRPSAAIHKIMKSMDINNAVNWATRRSGKSAHKI